MKPSILSYPSFCSKNRHKTKNRKMKKEVKYFVVFISSSTCNGFLELQKKFLIYFIPMIKKKPKIDFFYSFRALGNLPRSILSSIQQTSRARCDSIHKQQQQQQQQNPKSEEKRGSSCVWHKLMWSGVLVSVITILQNTKSNFEEPKKHKLKFLVSLLRESHQICPILIDSLQDRVYNKYKKYPLSFKR